MFKKFFLVLTLCLGIFSSLAFADTIDNSKSLDNSKALGIDDNIYYLEYTGSESGRRILYTFDTIKSKDSGLFIENCLQYFLVGDSFELSNSVAEISLSMGTFVNFDTNNLDVYDYIVSNNLYSGDLIDPPSMAPTVVKAIQGIAPQLSNQLKEYLPIGVIILSLGLGVSLIPRLVRLFL